MARELIPDLDSAKTFALFRWDVENSVGGEALQFAAWLEGVFDWIIKPSVFWTELAAEIEADAAKVPAAVAAAYAKETAEQANAKQTYTINVVYEAGQDAVTGRWLISDVETLTIEAASLEEARRQAPLHTKLYGNGRWMRLYHNGVELLGNF